MQRISPEEWSNSEGITPAGRAFVQSWLEIFHYLTIDNYRVKHLNVRLGFEELRYAILECETSSIDTINVEDIASELVKLMKDDPLIAAILPNHHSYYASLLQPLIGKGTDRKAPHPGLKVLTEHICEVLKNHYRQALLIALREAVTTNDTERTVQLVSLTASDLVGSGYDLRHLYWRGRFFINRPARHFQVKFEEFLAYFITSSTESYLIAHRLDFKNPTMASSCPSAIGTISIMGAADVMASHPNLITYIINPTNSRLAICSIEALDPFAASRKAANEFYRVLDIVQFAFPSGSIRTPDSSYVSTASGRIQTVPTSMELLGPLRIAQEEVNRRVAQLSRIHGRVDEISKRRLELGLQYLRRGLNESAPQGQFLNYWIGLEAIAGGKHRSEIATLRRTVPRMISLGHSRQLVRDLYENLVRLGIEIDPVLSLITTDLPDPLRKVEALWRCVNGQATQAGLLGLTAGTPLLQHRIQAVSKLLRTAISVRMSMEHHEKEVEWHVQRLYRVRNAIVHGGYVPEDLTHLASHLATYLWVLIRSILGDFASDSGTSDIKAFFDKHLKIHEMLMSKLQEQGTNDPPFAVVLEPTSLWPYMV